MRNEIEKRNRFDSGEELLNQWEMARDNKEIADEIRPNLWLGTAQAANNRSFLQKNRIQYLLSIGVRPFRNLAKANDFDPEHHLYIDIEDNPSERILKFTSSCTLFIQQALDKKQAVLVHCMMGISRSPSIVICYLMETEHLSYEEAFASVKAKRWCAHPNSGFEKELIRYGKHLSRKKKIIS